jgi:hypothetical protein
LFEVPSGQSVSTTPAPTQSDTPSHSVASSLSSQSGISNPSASTNYGLTGVSSFGYDSNANYSDPYKSYSDNGKSSGLTDASASFNRSSSGSDFYRASGWNDDRNNDDEPKDQYDNAGDHRDRPESRSSNDNGYSWSNRRDYGYDPDGNYYDFGSPRESEFLMESPLPGYSSRYPVGTDDEAVSTPPPATPATVTTSTASTAVTETKPIVPPARKPLSLQEKLERRLATPFSISPSNPQDASTDQYIPPDFLPPHDNGIVKLVDVSTEPAVMLLPVTFVSGTTSNASPDAVTTSAPGMGEGGEVAQ